MTSYVEQLGGEGRLRMVVGAFVDRMAQDQMIGFFFRRVPLPALKEREFEHAAAHLGSDIAYRGRPLRAAHGKLGILAGQFRRRLVLLEEVLAEFGAPPAVVNAWLAHQRRQEAEVRPQAC